ncbi:hypothetical protein QDY71_07575 [Kingella negevensis]|uniref:Uncharacterized protein n=1 Tax=Kingella negevensis TaxID=1522312 RepID=A0A238HGW9_9NEIS|nr:hypothetical protein [Kingella negevensis]MDK4684342.1 hypothetical protein [Kingella negevensis]MDK4697608.1 hypothetical protein [Kingella negevensis]SNB61556.1 Uncharacterised protein [Kingella negevensis]
MLFGALVAYFGLSEIGGIRKDYRIGQNSEVIDAQIDGRCRARKLFFVSCDVVITHENGITKKEFSYIGMTGDIEVQAIANRYRPEQVTLDIAADKIMARGFYVMFIAGIGLGMLGLGLFTAFVVMPRHKQILE